MIPGSVWWQTVISLPTAAIRAFIALNLSEFLVATPTRSKTSVTTVRVLTFRFIMSSWSWVCAVEILGIPVVIRITIVHALASPLDLVPIAATSLRLIGTAVTISESVLPALIFVMAFWRCRTRVISFFR